MNNVIIRPRGFFERFLRKQLDGLTGHIEQAGYPFDRPIWGKAVEISRRGAPSWWVYEQTAYHLDGYIRCGILLNDKAVVDRASKIIYSVLDKPDADGFLGPAFMKQTDGGNRWAYVVFFRACMALYEYNGDSKILTAMTNHYLGGSARHVRRRDVMNVEMMAWLYRKTGNKALLDMAEADYAEYNANCPKEEFGADVCDAVALSDKKPHAHGVSYNEYSKLGAILYLCTGNRKYLDASIAAYKKIDKFFMLPSGCNCSNELMNSDYCMESYETCDISDYTWSLGYLFDATHNGEYCDKIDKCIFNAGMGSVLEDFKGLQYFSCANQIVAHAHSNHNEFSHGGKWMSYRPNPGTECCPGNVNRFMPNYIFNSVKRVDNDIYIALFCDCEYDWGDVRITECTEYPFKEYAAFSIESNKRISLKLRIPEWADNAEICINEEVMPITVANGFATLDISGECYVTVRFKSSIRTIKANGGVYFQKGALVYSLGQVGRREIDIAEERASAQFPAYNMYPTEKWNYGVDIADCAPVFFDGSANEFDLRQDMPYIEITAHEAIGWELLHSLLYDVKNDPDKSRCTEYDFTPSPLSVEKFDRKKQHIKLYPYGACKLRITVFPDIAGILQQEK